MALYSFANGQIIPALRHIYRARYLAILICGDDHPDMAQLDVCSTITIIVIIIISVKNNQIVNFI